MNFFSVHAEKTDGTRIYHLHLEVAAGEIDILNKQKGYHSFKANRIKEHASFPYLIIN